MKNNNKWLVFHFNNDCQLTRDICHCQITNPENPHIIYKALERSIVSKLSSQINHLGHVMGIIEKRESSFILVEENFIYLLMIPV